MKTKRYSQAEIREFIRDMRAVKEAERANVNIYTDALLLVTVVVELGGQWWLVPRSRGGWQRRRRLRLSPQAELERLTRARHISADWLGICDV